MTDIVMGNLVPLREENERLKRQVQALEELLRDNAEKEKRMSSRNWAMVSKYGGEDW